MNSGTLGEAGAVAVVEAPLRADSALDRMTQVDLKPLKAWVERFRDRVSAEAISTDELGYWIKAQLEIAGELLGWPKAIEQAANLLDEALRALNQVVMVTDAEVGRYSRIDNWNAALDKIAEVASIKL